MFPRLAGFYTRSFERHPWITLAVTNGALSVVADSIAQGFELYGARQADQHPASQQDQQLLPPLEGTNKEAVAHSSSRATGFDLLRSSRFLGFGMLMAPPLDVWNKLLERRFPVVQTGRVRLPLLLRRVVVDQLVFGPYSVAAFIGIISVFEGHTPTEIGDKYRNMFTEALLANWQVWPVVQLVNFRFMPLKYRVPFMSTCGVFWTIYLSLLNMSKWARVEKAEREAAQSHA